MIRWCKTLPSKKNIWRKKKKEFGNNVWMSWNKFFPWCTSSGFFASKIYRNLYFSFSPSQKVSADLSKLSSKALTRFWQGFDKITKILKQTVSKSNLTLSEPGKNIFSLLLQIHSQKISKKIRHFWLQIYLNLQNRTLENFH